MISQPSVTHIAMAQPSAHTYAPLEGADYLGLLAMEALGQKKGELRYMVGHFNFQKALPFGAL
jgi:hypothetical protein